MDESDKMRSLHELDKGTEWEQSGDLLAANDPDEDDGMANVLAHPHLHALVGGEESGLDSDPTIDDILNTVRDMTDMGGVEDLLVIVNTPEGQQHLMTTLQRNDHIIGMLSVATMNWHSSQIASQNYIEEDEV